jgi:hypothetical protein
MNSNLSTARQLGTEHGQNAGTWVIDGNTDDEAIRRIVNGHNDGDPEILDMQPSPLSGEFADDPTPRDILAQFGIDGDDFAADEYDYLLGEFEAGYSEGYWKAIVDAAAARGIGTVRAVLTAAGIDPTTSYVVSVAEVRFSTNRPYPNNLETRDVLVFSHACINDQQGDDPLSVGNYRALESLWSDLQTADPYVNAKYFAIDMDDTAPAELVEVINGLEDYPCIDDEAMSRAEMELGEEHWTDYGRRDTFAALAELSGADVDDLADDTVIAGLVEDFTFSGGHQLDASGQYVDIYPEYVDPSFFEFHAGDVAAAVVEYVAAWLTVEKDTTTTRFELTITTDNNAHSGKYDTFAEAREAAKEAAAIDDLRIDVRYWSAIGTETVGADGAFVDSDGLDWFEFTITRTDQ